MISTHSRSPHFRTARPDAPRQGFSLIEVAIALVIFVIGALAIIRIFPGALSVIGNSGNQQIARNLNTSALARLKSEGGVPSATFNTTDLSGTFFWTTTATVNHTDDYRDSLTSVVGVPRFNDSLPTTEEISTQAAKSALSRYRAILGEKTRVFELTGSLGAERYVLTQFPISVASQAASAAIAPLLPVISQEYDLANVRIKTDGKFDFSQVSDATDSTNTLFPAANFNPNSLLYVSYRYKDANGFVWGIKEEAVVLPATSVNPNAVDFGAVQVNPPSTGIGAVAASGIIPEIIDVRLKRFIETGDFGGATPFEKIGDARRGLVKTNVPTGTPVFIDYVADWSVLLQDGAPSISSAQLTPAPTAGETYKQIALGVSFIEDKTPVGIYSLLLNRDNNMAYRSSFGENSETTATDATKRLLPPNEDDLRAGRVTFVTPENSSVRARVAYQTRDSWAQQLSVAATTYKPFVSNNPERWRDYTFGSVSTDNFVYFHAGEAGKSIEFTYTYDTGTVDISGNPIYQTITSRPMVISSEIFTAAGVVSTAFSDQRVARIELLDLQNQVLPRPRTTPGRKLVSIQGVRGTSVTMRSAYINGNQYKQKIDTTTRGAN